MRYEGQTRDGKPWGNGTLTFRDGSMIIGQFVSGVVYGYARDVSNGSEFTFYEGSWKYGRRWGKGVEKNPDGSEYTGNFEDGYRHGYGLMILSDDPEIFSKSYEGQWKRDFPSGYGIETRKDGAFYEGEFQNGSYHGFGKYTFSFDDNIETVEGIWENNEVSGNGTVIFKDGERYFGEWRNDARNGFGTTFSKDNFNYTGQWKNSTFHGAGIYYYEFLGTEYDRYDGNFENGQFVKPGILYWKNGDKYEGEFEGIQLVETAPNILSTVRNMKESLLRANSMDLDQNILQVENFFLVENGRMIISLNLNKQYLKCQGFI